ncbi:MAG TPA: S26 family signal peptidase [Steroidobacteraceae bacterium]|nr:S26 family signal peptidase [Steroidobacteraceae bacterium]
MRYDVAAPSRGLSRGTDGPASYDAGDWAWEFVRRNPDYRANWRSSVPRHLPHIILKDGTRLLRLRRRFPRAERWGLYAFADPSFPARRAPVFWHLDALKRVIRLRAGPPKSHESTARLSLSNFKVERIAAIGVDNVPLVLMKGPGSHVPVEICGLPALTLPFAVAAMVMAFDVRAPLVIYNASGSAPLGFYYVEDRLPTRGELALVKPPPLLELMIVARKILPPSVPLVKQVTAVGGDEVCRSNEPPGTIAINGKVVAEVFDQDREGRRLPSWDGCIRLVDGEFFLLQPHPYSFDSRYFGPVSRCDVLGVAQALWTWNPND